MDGKDIKNKVKKILKENSSIVIFSEGITLMQGDTDHCICSIAWSLNELRNRNKYIYTEIMKNLERLKNKDKESKIKENTFKVGDRIEVTKDCWLFDIKKGMKGTIIHDKSESITGTGYGIEFDEDIGGHDIEGKCKDGHGAVLTEKWFIKSDTGEEESEE